MVIFFLGTCQKQTSPPPRIAFRMTDTALVGGTCVDIRKSMSRFVDAYSITVDQYNADNLTVQISSRLILEALSMA